MYLTTQTGKRIIDHTTHLPLFNKPVELRIKQVSKQLGYTKQQLTWERVKIGISLLQIT